MHSAESSSQSSISTNNNIIKEEPISTNTDDSSKLFSVDPSQASYNHSNSTQNNNLLNNHNNVLFVNALEAKYKQQLNSDGHDVFQSNDFIGCFDNNSNNGRIESKRTFQLLSHIGMLAARQHSVATCPHRTDGLDCEYCGHNYEQVKKIRRHLTFKKEKKYECDECGKKFGYKHILQEHKNLHYGIKPYSCPLCNKRFAAKSNLIQHRHRHAANHHHEQHDMIMQQQTINNKIFDFKQIDAHNDLNGITNEENISQQEKQHQQGFSCTQCDARFTSERALKGHETSSHGRATIRTSGVMSFRCVICGNTFLDGDSYAAHCRTMHPDTNVNPKSSQIRSNFNDHQRPNNEVTISSDHHSQWLSFNQESIEKKADFVEMGVQVDCCSQPDFSNQDSVEELFNRHIAQGKMFKCKHCEIFFKERGLYSMHIVLHGDEHPWQCAICGRRMADRNEFTLHFVNQQHYNA